MHRIKIGTRASKLARWQAEYAAKQLAMSFPNIETEVVCISTQGDRVLDVPLSKLGERGVFTKELERALFKGQVDICIHSMKDMPSIIAEGAMLAGCLARGEVRDVLIAPNIKHFSELPSGASVATGSLRRLCALRTLRSDLDYVEVRGNIETRLAKVSDGAVDALVLAGAGVARLGYEGRIAYTFSPSEVVPAAGQGAIGLEVRSEDKKLASMCGTISDLETEVCVATERLVMYALEGGCQVPLGAYAHFSEGCLWLESFVGTPDGTRMLRALVSTPLSAPKSSDDSLQAHYEASLLAQSAVEHLVGQGGRGVLEEARRDQTKRRLI